MVDHEEALTGGNVADEVVRVGQTVRKPVTAATPAIAALLQHLTAVGFVGSPRHLGVDDTGRQMLEYIAGVLANQLPPLDLQELHRLGCLIRDPHDATVSFQSPPDAQWEVVIPPDRDELVCHHDLAPWNLVRDGERWVFIDWDGAGPGSRLWDLAYAAHGFVGMHQGGDPVVDGARLRALVDGYGLNDDQRSQLPGLITAHVRGMYELLHHGHASGTQPWARLWAEGHGDHWGPAADYADRSEELWTAALRG